MNKSDIIKAAEEAQEHWLGGFAALDRMANALIAAAELLKQVEVVEVGSEPQDGDYIDYEYRHGESNIPRRRRGVAQCALGGASRKDAHGVHKIYGQVTFEHLRQYPNFIILERNGKPVITKGEV